MAKEQRKRIAVLDRDKCVHGRGCHYECIEFNPGVRMGNEGIVKGPDEYPVINEEICVGPEISAKMCPFAAIKVVNLPTEIGEPLFQYGQNTFRIYGLPLPEEKSVVGVVGANGMGKSTALRLLAGQLRPNFGKFTRKKISMEEIRQGIASRELKQFFEKYEGGAKLAYKPQNVEHVRDVFDGTVGELIADVAGKKKLDAGISDAIDAYGLNSILNRKINSISGGELQKASICAAALKDADAYFFDEPSSYLDVKQRLLVARNIRKLAESGKSVLVVEHDLAILDYLCDYAYIFYGSEGAYGMVSGVKNARAGINEFLSGYLKEENVRFREHEIKFSLAGAEERKGKVEFEYGEMMKKYDTFSLSCKAGEVREGEVIGILGENAIGKTTFIKMLAGVEKPSEGDAPAHKLKISYKQQYVKPDFDGTVAELFAQNKLVPEIFEDAKRALRVEELMLKKVKKLSGGELQRVAIALAISRDADIYLLDEPSAFLDIDARLSFAHALRKIMESSEKVAFVVDHDLVLVDALASRLIVFTGEPGKNGVANEPMNKKDGMNAFLKELDITLRRDKESLRPRVNKHGSSLDLEQRKAGEYYYYSTA